MNYYSIKDPYLIHWSKYIVIWCYDLHQAPRIHNKWPVSKAYNSAIFWLGLGSRPQPINSTQFVSDFDKMKNRMITRTKVKNTTYHFRSNVAGFIGSVAGFVMNYNRHQLIRTCVSVNVIKNSHVYKIVHWPTTNNNWPYVTMAAIKWYDVTVYLKGVAMSYEA